MRDLFSDIVPFVTVAELGSFRAAATRLGVTAASVSRAVARLEDELGARLLNRTTRRVALSATGELFLARCREAMAQVRAGRDLVAMAQTVAQGELAVSLPAILGRFVVGQLGRFLARYPGLGVHLHFTDRFTHLLDEGIDVAVRIGELSDSSLVARRLMTTRWATVAAPAYLARHGTPSKPDDLATHNCLKFRSPRGGHVEWTFRSSPRAPSSSCESVATRGNLDTDQGEQLIEAAATGIGICQAFTYLVEAPLREGRLVEILGDYAADGPSVHALCLPGQQSTPRVRALLDFLSETFAEHAHPL